MIFYRRKGGGLRGKDDATGLRISIRPTVRHGWAFRITEPDGILYASGDGHTSLEDALESAAAYVRAAR